MYLTPSGAVPRLTVITSYSSCPNLHQMSFHLSFVQKQTLWSVFVRLLRHNNREDTQDKCCKEHLLFGFLKNAKNFFFAVKVLDLFIIGYVWEFCNMYTHNLCHYSGLSHLVLSSKVLAPMLAQDQGANDFVHLQRNSLHRRKNSPDSFIDPDFSFTNTVIFSLSFHFKTIKATIGIVSIFNLCCSIIQNLACVLLS